MKKPNKNQYQSLSIQTDDDDIETNDTEAIIASSELQPFAKLADYYLSKNSFLLQEKNRCYSVFKNSCLAVVSLSTMWLYIQPALDFGKRHDSEALGILEVIGNTIAACLSTYNAAKMYWDYLEQQAEIEKEFKDFIKKEQKLKDNFEMSLIISGAIASALPLVAPAIQYTQNSPWAIKILQPLLIAIAYSFIHTLPMYLLVQTPFWRKLFSVLFEILYYLLYEGPRRCLRSPQQVKDEALARQTIEDQMALKNNLSSILEKARKAVLNKIFDDFNNPLVLKNYKPSDEIKGYQYYLTMLKLTREERALDQARSLPGWIGYINSVISEAIGVAGGLTVPVSISGYMMSNFLVMRNWTDSETLSYILTSIPVFISSVFLGHFGRLMFKGIYDSIIDFLRNTYEVPVAIRLYPKMVLSLIMGALLLSVFSSGVAEELVYKNFPADWQFEIGGMTITRDVLIGFARYGISVFSLVSLVQVTFYLTMLYAQKYGDEASAFVAKFVDNIQYMRSSLSLLDGSLLEKEFTSMKEVEDRKLLLGIKDDEFKKLVNHERNFSKPNEEEEEISPSSSWCGKRAFNKIKSYFSFWKSADEAQGLQSREATEMQVWGKNSLGRKEPPHPVHGP